MHNPSIIKVFEQIRTKKQVNVNIYAGFNHTNKVQEWLKIIESYFEHLGVAEREKIELIFCKLKGCAYRLLQQNQVCLVQAAITFSSCFS